jgi:hypothetical protein
VEEKIVQKPVMKKRKRIADPTFRVGLSSDNEEGVVERSRKRSKKPVRSKDKALPISPSKNVGQKLRAESEMHGDTKDTEAPISREDEQRAYMQEVEEAGVSGGANDDEEFVWERDWCMVM